MTDSGTAVPAANILNVLGGVGITTSGSGDTILITNTAPAAETLTGNSGGAVATTLGNINTVGTGSITVVGNPGTSTLTTQLTGLTNHSVLVGAGSATITKLSVGSNGQVLLGATAADPAFATLTSPDSSITFTTGANSLALAVAGGTTVGKTITGNSGGALSPTAGNWNILGASTAAGTSPVSTAGSVSTLTVNVQKSQAIASTDATKVGLAAFDSAAFSVDANGFVSLVGGGEAIDSIGVQASTPPGTSPVVPTVAGLVTINGAAVAAHSIPLQSNSIAANTLQLEVQYASSVAGSDATKGGIASFFNQQFTTDSNGFTVLSNGLPIVSIDVDAHTGPGTDPVVPNSSGVLAVTGAQVANGTVGANVIRTDSLAANSMTIEIQRSAANASTDSTKNGVSHFDSASFAVDANGFVTAAGGGLIKTITGNTGGAEVPSSGNFNILGTGSITVAGSANTETVQLTGLTNHAIQIGAGTATLTQLGAGTTGQVLQTNTTADPTWSTATYPSVATTTGTILRADGTNWVKTTSTFADTYSASNLLYSNGANTVTGLATANTAILTTNSSGVPSLVAAPLSIAYGGTNATSMSTSTGIVKYDGTSLVTSTTAKIDSSNRYTNTSQPAFNQRNGSTRTNVTGDGTVYTAIFNTATSTQQGSGFDGTSTFTAPVTGWYHFDYGIALTGIVAQTQTYIALNHVAVFTYIGPLVLASATASGGALYLTSSKTILMTANDTVTISVASSGSTKTVSVDATNIDTYFQGYLLF